MKKILFMLAMLPMMVFTACSSDDKEDTALSVISSGEWYISNHGSDDYLNTREKDNNWVSIDHKHGIIDLYMTPNLGSVIVYWNKGFSVNGNKITIESEYSNDYFEFTEVNENTAIAKFHYTIINPIEFSIYLRKK